MRKRKTSETKKSVAALLQACLILIFNMNLTVPKAASQTRLNLSEPLRKCLVYDSGNGLGRVVASDNDQNLIITTDNYSLISLNPYTLVENWKSLTGGKLRSELMDADNLYFVSSVEKDDRIQFYSLNAISLKTGITNWQFKFDETVPIKLLNTEDIENLFLSTGTSKLAVVAKENGKIHWTKEFSKPLIAVSRNHPSGDEIFINTSDSYSRILIKNGQLIDASTFGKVEMIDSVIGKDFILGGFSTGEIVKYSYNGGGSGNELWKVKAGGGISGFLLYRDNVLVTSLDNFIYLYSIDSGKLRWKRRVAGRINLKPRIYGDLAVITNSGDNSTSIIDLRDGKIINRIQPDQDIYLTGQPVISGSKLVLSTSKGIQFFSNANAPCK